MLNINIGILWVVIFGMAQKSWMPHCRKSWTILLSRHLIDGNPDWDNSDSSYHYRSISLRCLLIHWMSLSYWVRTWLSSVECRDVSGCACSIDGHDLYLRLRDLNQHESTVVSIGLTFTENWAETARVAWAFVALWSHPWHVDFHAASFYCTVSW